MLFCRSGTVLKMKSGDSFKGEMFHLFQVFCKMLQNLCIPSHGFLCSSNFGFPVCLTFRLAKASVRLKAKHCHAALELGAGGQISAQGPNAQRVFQGQKQPRGGVQAVLRT